jgi:hypothetical protein
MVWLDRIALVWTPKKRPNVIGESMPEILILSGIGAEVVNVRKVWRARVESSAVDYEVLIYSDAHGFAAKRNEALDVILSGVNPITNRSVRVEALGREYDDVSTLRVKKIVRNAIHKQMVAGDDFHLDDVLAALEVLSRHAPAISRTDSCALEQIVGGKPNRVRAAVEDVFLLKVEKQKPFRRPDLV